MMKRKIIFVLGMHRSGTSVITRVINLLGAGLPENLMPANSDNATGYWESKNIASINNQILNLAGSSWFDNQIISADWLLSNELIALRSMAKELLTDMFNNTKQTCLVLKDPRICRLLPFWHDLMNEMGIEYNHVFIIRHPEEVFASFKVRYQSPEFRPAAIIHPQKLNLLWMRYVLDAEIYSRNKRRHVVNYEDLLASPIETINELAEYLNGFSKEMKVTDPNEKTLHDFVSKKYQHYEYSKGQSHSELSLSSQVYQGIINNPVNTALLDNIYHCYNEVSQNYQVLVNSTLNGIHDDVPWFNEMADMISRQQVTSGKSLKKVMFFSGSPLSRGHTYRVVHQIEALNNAGISSFYRNLEEEFDLDELKHFQIIVVFRAEWNKKLRAIYKFCEEHNVIKVFDVDDLVFQPEMMTEINWDYLRQLDVQAKQQWKIRFTNYAKTLTKSDHVIVPTQTLADVVRSMDIPVDVIANGIGQQMLNCSQFVLDGKILKPSQIDGCLRLGYASGTPTHQKDFAEIYPVICQILKDFENVVLVVVGFLNLEEFPELKPYTKRIETRPIVEHMNLFSEYYRFDINLAPLQKNNPFCECKSQLKYHEAALVEVPTVSSATQPYQDAIHMNITGFYTDDNDSWYNYISVLLQDSNKRKQMGRNAKRHVIAKFGPDTQSSLAAAVLSKISNSYKILPPQNIIIFGMHRSGTSCLTGSLQQLGLHLGDVSKQDPYNLKGNRENRNISLLDESILNYSGGCWSNIPKEITWTQDHIKEQDDILKGYYSLQEPRGFKDPRMLFVLPFWKHKLKKIEFIGTFRHPLAVAKSLYSRETSSVQMNDGIELWYQYNKKLLEYHNVVNFNLLNFDLPKDQYIQKLIKFAERLGLSINRNQLSFFDDNLRKQNSKDGLYETELPNKVISLYLKLKKISLQVF